MAAIPRLKRVANEWTKVIFVRPGLLGIVSDALIKALSIRTFTNGKMLIQGLIVIGVAVVAYGCLRMTADEAVCRAAGSELWLLLW